MNTLWCIHIVKYYSVLKRKETPPTCSNRISLEDTRLRKISLVTTQRQMKVWFHLWEVPGRGKVKDRVEWWVLTDGGTEGRKFGFNREWASALKKKKRAGDGWQWWLQNTWILPLSSENPGGQTWGCMCDLSTMASWRLPYFPKQMTSRLFHIGGHDSISFLFPQKQFVSCARIPDWLSGLAGTLSGLS
jgi:hypothetical protein